VVVNANSAVYYMGIGMLYRHNDIFLNWSRTDRRWHTILFNFYSCVLFILSWSTSL